MNYEQRKQQGSAIARQASAILRKAGEEKSGRYSIYGYANPGGYSVTESGNGTKDVPTAVLLCCGLGTRTGEREAAQIVRWTEIVEADGRFTVTVTGRYKSTAEITRKTDDEIRRAKVTQAERDAEDAIHAASIARAAAKA
tara:strand:- start:26441 stop:26863 length:423 start_codon:yes stop_codon:yes gene_type:complete